MCQNTTHYSLILWYNMVLQQGTTMDKAKIVSLLRSNDKAVARALVVLNERQTADEQATENTRYLNGRGFRPCHARMGTSMANFYTKFNRLSPKQVAYWRAPMKDGKMRIEIYAGQLLDIAQAKAATVQPAPAEDDVARLKKEYAELAHQYAEQEYLEDYNFLERLHDRMIQIREELEEITRCEYKFNRDAVLV